MPKRTIPSWSHGYTSAVEFVLFITTTGQNCQAFAIVLKKTHPHTHTCLKASFQSLWLLSIAKKHQCI